METSTSVWEYYYDASFSQPLHSVVNHKQPPEIRLDATNIRPRPGNFDAVNTALKDELFVNKQVFIYTVRHGTAIHNEQSDRYSKPIAWRFLARLRANFDPELTNDGVEDAKRAGRILKGLIDEEGAPVPVRIYTSPLSRCLQTAMHMVKELRLDSRSGGPGVVLSVRDGLREWKGCGHNHQSDCRGTVSDILARIDGLNESLGMDVRADIGPCLVQHAPGQETREDELEDIGSETFTDVDVRVRGVLDEIFEVQSSGSCVMLVLHNRSNKSLLRTLGHSQDEVNDLDLENCAILSYLVKRTKLTDYELQIRKENEGEGEGSGQQSHELAIAHAEINRQAALAAEEVRRPSAEEFQDLENYLIGERDRGDRWAWTAVEDLYNCRNGLG